MSERKKKFIVWLNNKTDRRDDEWIVVWAYNKEEVKKMDLGYEYDITRYYRGEVLTAAEFKNRMGITAGNKR